MLKNKLWIVALLVALTMAFFGCTNMGSLDDGSAPIPDVDLEIDGADITNLVAIGGSSSTVTVDGNKVTLKGTTSAGFWYEFPAEAATYTKFEIFIKIVDITAGRPGLLIKRNRQMANPIGITNDDDPEYQPLNDADSPSKSGFPAFAGNHFEVGKTYTTGEWSMSRFDGGIAFQHQAWNPDPNSVADYTIEVAKVVFKGGGAEPPVVVPPPAYEGAANKVIYLKSGEQGDVIIDTDPSVKGVIGMTISDKGVVTMTQDSVLYYKFPTSAAGFTGDPNIEAEYDTIIFEYTISDVVLGDKTQLSPPQSGPSDGKFKARVRDYTNEKAYTGFAGANEWPNLNGAGDQTYTTQTWGAQGSGGIAINYNWNDRNADGALSLKVKITRVVFMKEDRFFVTFVSDDPPVYKYVTVAKGNSIGTANYPAWSKTGYTFYGWFTMDENGDALDYVGPGMAIDKNLDLIPYASAGKPPDVTLGDGTTGNLKVEIMDKIKGAAATGSVIRNADGTITQTGGIWSLPLTAISPIWFVAETITFTFEYTNVPAGNASGHNWKTGDLWNGNADAVPEDGQQYPGISEDGTKTYTFKTSVLSGEHLSGQTSGSSGSFTFDITKVELKF